jgi:hypothetical protein
VIVLEFFLEGRHLVVDVVVTTVYRNTIFTNASTILGFTAKQVEDRKFLADRASSQPMSPSQGSMEALTSSSPMRWKAEAALARTPLPFSVHWTLWH